MKFIPAVERSINGGSQKIYAFSNGYGASVVMHDFSYGGKDGKWELAVLRFDDPSNLSDFDLTYDTPITNDVIGHLSEEEVDELLEKIAELA
jgi:hypothetical protein